MDYFEVDYMLGKDFYGLILFGVGWWMCFGYYFGNVMVFLMLVYFFYSFDWRLFVGVIEENFDMFEIYKLVGLRKKFLFLIVKFRSLVYLY